MHKFIYIIIGLKFLFCSLIHAQTDSIVHLSLRQRIDKIADSKTYKNLYIGVPLIAGGLIVKSEDDHFRNLRNDYIPTLRYHYDDYLQYLPAVAMVGMKIGGVKSRSSWGRMLTSDAFSVLLMFTTVRVLKSNINVERPDGSDNNSFPSGHTATAFMTATMMDKEYGEVNPWYSVGSYAVATATGLSREANNKHWMSDVMVGAGIGILSTEIGYLLADMIFKDRGITHFNQSKYVFSTDYRPSFAGVYIGLNKIPRPYTLTDGRSVQFSAGSRTGIEGAYFFNPYIGVGGQVLVSNMSILVNNVSEENGLQSTSYFTGPYFSYPISSRFFVGSKLLIGYNQIRNSTILDDEKDSWGSCTGLSITYRATEKLGTRLFTDYTIRKTSFLQPNIFQVLTIGGSINVMF